jgi:hypothetical protein
MIARRSFKEGLPVEVAERMRANEALVLKLHQEGIKRASERRQSGGRCRKSAENEGIEAEFAEKEEE